MRRIEQYNIEKELVSRLLPTQNVLTDKEVAILQMRYLNKNSNFGGGNLCEIGKKHYLRDERIRQIIEKLQGRTPIEYSHQLRMRRQKRLVEATKLLTTILESYKEEELTSGMIDMFVEVFFALRNIDDPGQAQLRMELKEKFLARKPV